MGFISRTSRPIFLPSLVTQSILSTDASTVPEWISAARLLNSCTISFWRSDGFATTVSNFASGTGKWSWSAVLMSATSLNMDISSGRLKNLANLVLARYPVPSGASSIAVVVSPKVDAQQSKWVSFFCCKVLY